MLARDEDSARFRGIIEAAIAAGDIERAAGDPAGVGTESNPSARKRAGAQAKAVARRARAATEAHEAEALLHEIQEKHKRKQDERGEGARGGASPAGLAELIKSRQAEREGQFSAWEAKYASADAKEAKTKRKSKGSK